jgi:sugar lactone lactonase YvrE
VDGKGKYYIADTYNNRIVSFDTIEGKNWTVFGGTDGAGVNQFNNPQGIWVDATGHIYIADTGNDRIVRVDDMSGKNWITYGTTGNSAGNFRTPVGIMVR